MNIKEMLDEVVRRLELKCTPQVEKLDTDPFLTWQYRRAPLIAAWHSDGTQEGRAISGATWIVELTYVSDFPREPRLTGIDVRATVHSDLKSLQSFLDSLR